MSKEPAKPTRANRTPRTTAEGDIPPDLTPDGIERFEVESGVEGAVDAKITAVKDLLASSDPAVQSTVRAWLLAELGGASAEDRAAILGRALLERRFELKDALAC